MPHFRFHSAEHAQAYWESQFPAVHITHMAKPHPVTRKLFAYDVRTFVEPNDFRVQQQAFDIVKKVPPGDNNARMDKLFDWVKRTNTYKHDDAQTGEAEWWFRPAEMMHVKKGDCEDGAILLASLAISCGIPRWRVMVDGGWVDDREGNVGGHAWVRYCRDPDYEWVPYDWCYWPDSTKTPAPKRKRLHDRDYYTIVWFSFNDQVSYGSHDWIIDGRVDGGDILQVA